MCSCAPPRLPLPGRRPLAVALLAGLGAAAAAVPPALVSSWRSAPIAVDGLPAEWTARMPLERGPLVAAVNDDEFLYLVVSAKEPALAAPLATGLIVWLDASGRRAQTFGIRVPGLNGPAPSGAAAAAPGPSGSISTEVWDRFDLLGPGRNRRLVDLTPELGLALATGFADGEVIYELQIPLRRTGARPYAVGAEPGATIGLGLATPEAPRDPGRRPELVGRSGYIGGHPYVPGGFAPYRESDGQPKPIEIWTSLALARMP